MNSLLSLPHIRTVLARLEDTIIFALLERAQFAQNACIYDPHGFPIKDYTGSFLMYLLHGTEKLHATARRYVSPDEHPFCAPLPPPVLPVLDMPSPLAPTTEDVTINDKILAVYITDIVPRLCREGDDEQYGSSAVSDVNALQALSKRIHYGMFVAESKYLAEPATVQNYINAGDADAILSHITTPEVEATLLERVLRKTRMYCRDIEAADENSYKIDPQLVVDLYADYIIPLTKEVEVHYLLARTSSD